MIMPAITVMLNTVRHTDAFRDSRDAVLCVADDMAAQTFRDFELVVVDGIHAYRPDLFKTHTYPFSVTHVGPRQTPMVRDGRVAISAYKNTGIAHARGELLLTVDDCCWIDHEYLQRCWTSWSRDRVMLAAMAWAIQVPELPDGRKAMLDTDGKCVGSKDHPHTPPMYGFASFSLEAALAVNGYDEMMDGSQGLEDIDMGIRLQKAGFRIGLDIRHCIRTGPSSTPWDERIFPPYIDKVVKCCQSTLRLQLERNLVRANDVVWGSSQWSRLTPCYLKGPQNKCNAHGMDCAYPDSFSVREHPGLETLRREPPSFDLRRLRQETLAARGVH